MLKADMDEQPIDLVIDDASHRLWPTLVSFNTLFPAFRPGGRYLIEDWSGLHRYDAALQSQIDVNPEIRKAIEARLAENDAGAATDTPLSVLLFLLVLVSTYSPDVVPALEIADGWCTVTRGEGRAGLRLRPTLTGHSDGLADSAVGAGVG